MILLNQNRFAKVATCSLNQWALDFTGNKDRIIKSIRIAKEQGCAIRLGPELEVTGYSCEDHFLEIDTVNHSWEILASILSDDLTVGIMSIIGMPVIYNNLLYNCNIVVLNKKILLIRPKMMLSDSGNYHEGRYFTAWPATMTELESFLLPEVIQKIIGQTTVPIGNAIIQTKDTEIGIAMYEELLQMNPFSLEMGLKGVEIFLNNTVIHHQLKELETRIRVLCDTTHKNGGVHLYANQIGCDGGRLYFDGSSMIIMNGNLLKISPQFSLKAVEVLTSVVNLDAIVSRRLSMKSCGSQTYKGKTFPKLIVDFKISKVFPDVLQEYESPLNVKNVIPLFEEEIAKGPACYLYNYLKRSEASGFFLPLSGGADSAAVAAIVYNMALLIYDGIIKNQENVLQELRSIIRDDNYTPKSPQDICGKLFFTSYMGTKNNSSDTRSRAQNLAKEIGRYKNPYLLNMFVF